MPESLLAERDELARKRDAVRDELAAAKDELNQLKRARKRRSA